MDQNKPPCLLMGDAVFALLRKHPREDEALFLRKNRPVFEPLVSMIIRITTDEHRNAVAKRKEVIKATGLPAEKVEELTNRFSTITHDLAAKMAVAEIFLSVRAKIRNDAFRRTTLN